MKTVQIKECRKCGAIFYGGETKTILKSGDPIDLIEVKISKCPECLGGSDDRRGLPPKPSSTRSY